MKTLIGIIITWGILNVAACQDKTNEHQSIKILFVGNSLTYTNSLPELVTSNAKGKGISVYTSQLAFPNYALEDHWNEGQLQNLIKTGGFNFVVVQQGPSSQSDGRAMLLLYGPKLAAECKKAGAQLAFFMVWPAKANLHTFNGVITNYRDAAVASQSILCPVGEVWKNHFETTDDFSYYGPDEFHPSLTGSEIAAKVIVNSLFP
jgi:hypothetical protein